MDHSYQLIRNLYAFSKSPVTAWARISMLLLPVLFVCIMPINIQAQVVRTFTDRASFDQRGDIEMIGNVLITCSSADTDCADIQNGTVSGSNSNRDMEYVNIDAGAGFTNSSSADLSLPAGASVLFAGLYWGGRADPSNSARETLQFRVAGSGTYTPVSVDQIDTFTNEGDATTRPYAAFADVTSMVQAAGNGTYFAGDLAASLGSDGLGFYGGWNLIIIYQDDSEPFRRLTVFDGAAVVSSANNPDEIITVSGLLTPTSGAFDTFMGALVWEGDESITGDQFLLESTNISDAENPSTNFWNSSITRLGTRITDKNPDYVNQLAVDTDYVDASGILTNGATTADLEFNTSGDTYFPHALTFAVDLQAVDLTLTGGPCWRMLSSPIDGLTYAEMLDGLWTQGITGSDYDAAPNPNVFTWSNSQSGNDPADWQPLSDLTNTIPAGSGFMISVYDDDDYDGIGDGFPKTLTMAGANYTGNVSPSMNTTSEGWTLAGNPYGAPVDFSALTTADLTDIAYVYDRNYSGGDGGPTNGNTGGWRSSDGTYGDLIDGVIAVGQGFFVQNVTSPTSPSLTFTEASQTTGGQFYGKDNEQNNPHDYIRLELSGESLYNSLWIRFSEEGSMEPVYGDAVELMPFSEDYALFASEKTDGHLVDIGHFPLADGKFEIPINVDVTRAGTYTITATDLDLPEDIEFFLHDLETGELIPITKSFEYSFSIGQVAKSTPDEGINRCSAAPRKAKTTTSEGRFLVTVAAEGAPSELPGTTDLAQNYPNPFNPSTLISYQLPATSEVQLEVFDMLGRQVANLVEGTVEAGVHQVNFNAGHLTSGVYLYRLTAVNSQGGRQVFTRKLTLIK